MLQENTKKINETIANSLAMCTLAIIALLFCDIMDIFNFESKLKFVIIVWGSVTTLSPFILNKLNVPDEFLKYYILFVLATFIGALATFNGIGIYILFVLAPTVSCLYFDPKLTRICSTFSYFVMVASVYVNAAGKMEVKYRNWTHFQTFRAYIIGFTIEYLIITLFFSRILSRAKKLLDDQREAYLLAKAQDYRYELLIAGTEDVIFEYFIDEKRYKANRSIWVKKGEERKPIELVDVNETMPQYPYIMMLLEGAKQLEGKNVSESFELDFSYEQDGERIPLWYLCEGFLVMDEEKHPVSVIGKLHDITQTKLAQERLQQQRISDLFEKKNSIHEMLIAESASLDEKDFKYLSEGQRFVAQILDELKYAKNLREGQ